MAIDPMSLCYEWVEIISSAGGHFHEKDSKRSVMTRLVIEEDLTDSAELSKHNPDAIVF